MIDVPGFIEQEKIGIAQKHQQRADAIQKSDGNEQCEEPEDCPMKIEPMSGPRMDPRKSVVFKQNSRLEPVRVNPPVLEVTADLPRHEKPERDSKKDQRRNVGRRKRALLHLVQERSHPNHVSASLSALLQQSLAFSTRPKNRC